MGDVAWRKVWRDLALARGRAVLLVLALALSLAAGGTVASTYGVLAREMPRSFLASRPASATLVLEHALAPELLREVRARPDLAAVERRALVRGRLEVAPDRKLPLALFVIEDFAAMDVETVAHEDGAWPPPDGTLLVDRSSLAFLRTELGARFPVSLREAKSRELAISGVVVDTGVAPAWQEQAVYGYVTPATLAALGSAAELDLVKLRVREDALDAEHIEAVAKDVSAWLAARGVPPLEIRVPAPGRHPHQSLMNALVLVLLLFSALALVLSAVLVATLVSGLLARHARQIGAMKAIGATPARIALLYASFAVVLGGAAALVALGPSVWGARRLAALYADLSNVVLADAAVPWWAWAGTALAGVLAPLLAALPPVFAASRATVHEALSELGMYRGPRGAAPSTSGARAAAFVGPTLVLAWRHVLRRRRRLALSVLLLGTGGAVFLTGIDVAAATDRKLARGGALPEYDLELALGEPQPTEALLERVRALPSVAYVEPVVSAAVFPVRPGEAPVSHVHKDGGHGALRLFAIPPDSRFAPTVLAGRALAAGDVEAIALAPSEVERLGASIGADLVLQLGGRATTWRVVGVVAGIGLGGNTGLWITDAGYARATDTAGKSSGLRVIAKEHGRAGEKAARREIEDAFARAGIGIASISGASWWEAVLRSHVAIVRGALELLGIVLGAVGALTLAAATTTGVVERTREFGVLQALGATPARVVWVVVAEALLVGLVSWPFAAALGAALSAWVGAMVGPIVFGTPLPLVLSVPALAAWLGVTVCASCAAGALPAFVASRLTIREALAHV